MIYTNTNITKFAFIFLLLGTLSFALVQCSSSTDSSDGGGGGNGGGGDGNTPPSGISFNTGTLAPGQSASVTFEGTGSTDYVCTFHASRMQGSVTVEDGASTEAVTVTVREYSFSPTDITIGPGTQVTWVNEGSMNHTATSQ